MLFHNVPQIFDYQLNCIKHSVRFVHVRFQAMSFTLYFILYHSCSSFEQCSSHFPYCFNLNPKKNSSQKLHTEGEALCRQHVKREIGSITCTFD